jgi:uncharacterized protein (TIGR00730 family)
MTDPGAIRSVAVYCSSSSQVHPHYRAVAREVGAAIARSGRTVVYGGGKLGMMGEVSKAARGAGGRVVGIITTRLRDSEQLDPDNHENIVVDTMSRRKAMMVERSDAIAVLPGGLGTLEEFFEALVGRLVGEHDKPVVILNTMDPVDGTGFYAPLLAMLEHIKHARFAARSIDELFDVCLSTQELLTALDRHASRPTSLGDRRRFMPGLALPADTNLSERPT